MEITPNEISSVEEIGTLHGHAVKLVKCKGGFWIAIGRPKGKYSETALCAGSHSAIVKYNIERQYPDFQPNMMKSEGHVEPIVEKHSHFLSDDLRKSGHDVFSIQTGLSVEFHVTKQNAQVAKVTGVMDSGHILIHELVFPKEFTKAMAGAALEKAISCKVGLKLRK